MNKTAFAVDELAEIKESLKQIDTQGQDVNLNDNLKAKISNFMLTNKDASPKDFKKMRVLERSSEIINQELSKKNNSAKPEDYEQKIKNKEDRELFRITLNINKRRALRRYLFCKGSEAAALESAKKSSELGKQTKGLNPTSDNYIAIEERILDECRFNDSVIWGLLASYRYKHYREKYNKLMLRIIEEDQIEYDYSGSSTNEINGKFKNEFFAFLTNVNSLYEEPILKSGQMRLVAEAALTKYREAFSLQGISDVEDAYRVVQPMVVLATWLDYFKLEDLKKSFVNAYLTCDIAKQTLKVYSVNMKGFKETLDYLEQQ
jgi:hypothetical protein